MEYHPDNGYKFVEFNKYVDKKINEKVSEKDYYDGMRYLKMRFINFYTQINDISLSLRTLYI